MNQGMFATYEYAWSNLPKDLPKRIFNQKESLLQLVKSCDHKIAHLLTHKEQVYPPEPFPEISFTEMSQFIDLLLAIKKSTLLEIRNQIILLGLVIEAGNKAQLWKLPSPPVPVYMKREKNPFQKKFFTNSQTDKQLQQAILHSISHNIELSETAKVGRILLSAMINGGLLHKTMVQALLNQIEIPMQHINNMIYINLSLPFKGVDDQEFRRWFPDNVTTILLLKHQNLHKKSKRKHAWTHIKYFYQEIGFEPPKSLQQLIHLLTFALKLKIHPVIVEYQSRGIISHSLHEHVWLRLHNKQVSPNEPTVTDDIPSPMEYRQAQTVLVDFEWCAKLRNCLNTSTTKKDAKANILHTFENNKPKYDIARLVIAWVQYMLEHGSKISRPLALSTIIGYTTRILQGLPSLTFDLKFETLSGEALEEVYIQLLESAETQNLSLHLKKSLQEFHKFILRTHKHLSVNHSILNQASPLSPVDANIIDYDDYLDSLSYLAHNNLDFTHPDLPTISQLIVILGFRCGLRRSEALKLRIIDVQGKDQPEILIRPHELRRLKSKSAVRRMPLIPLLETHELAILLTWVKKRKAQERTKPYSEFLFSIPSKEQPIVPDELVFPIIHEALRKVTGDTTLRYHHLRHSFASWSLLRLMIADVGMPAPFFEQRPRTKQWLQQTSQSFKQALYNHDQSTRKHIYYITSLLGHSSPSMSLEHYIHCCDVLSNHIMSKFIAPIPATIWAKVIPAPLSTIYVWLNQGEQHIINKLKEQHQSRVITPLNPDRETFVMPNSKTDTSAYGEIITAWNILYLHNAQQISPQILALRYHVSEENIHGYIHQAKKIANITTSTRSESFRHRMMLSDDVKTRLLCPTKVKDTKGITLAKDFAARMRILKQQRHDDFKWVIDYFLNHAWNQSLDLIFRNTDDAKRYLSILSFMGIKNKDIALTWYHGKRLPDISDSQRKKHWRKALSIAKNRKLNRKKLNNTSILGEYGWLGIRPYNYLDSENKESKANYAFRFVFIMMAIGENSTI